MPRIPLLRQNNSHIKINKIRLFSPFSGRAGIGGCELLSQQKQRLFLWKINCASREKWF